MGRRNTRKSFHRKTSGQIAALRLLAGLLVAILWMGRPPADTVTAQNDLPEPRDFYGINFIAPEEPWLTLARESGAGVVRWQFNWHEHEPTQGNWTWERSDTIIPIWNDAGISVHAIMHGPPEYAKANPGSGLMPININLPWNHPQNYWGNFCYSFANRYRGQIGSYEIWNEPDLDIYWEGTAQQYFQVMKTCYQAIKAADPNVPVSMAGMALLLERDFFPEVVRLASLDPEGARNNYYFDAANIHMYISPELVYELTVETRGVLNRYGMGDKPIWITETAIPLRGLGIAPDYPYWRYATEDEAAWYFLQAVGNAYAAGADRLMWFRLADDNMDEAYGLLTLNAEIRPAYEAMQLATSLIYDIVEARREVREGVVITQMRRADGARIITMYSVTGVTVDLDIEAEAEAGVLINPLGGYSTIKPDGDNNYNVRLLPARDRNFSRMEDYTVGGPPQIIIEYDWEGPETSLTVTKDPDDPARVLVRWEGDDGEYGTGVDTYDVLVSHNYGEWKTWQAETTEQEAIYEMAEGGLYRFRARATDNAGNIGDYSEAGKASLVGLLEARIVNLRDQPVPYATVQLDDGTLRQADQNGVVLIELLDGMHVFPIVEGGGQGAAAPPPVIIELTEKTTVTWMLLPRLNIVPNGAFTLGLQGWEVFAGTDAQVVDLGTSQGNILRLRGERRPWGSPAVSAIIPIPSEMTSPVLSFLYRMPAGEQTLTLRVLQGDDQQVLWQTGASSVDFERVWLDLSPYAGQPVELRFELYGAKGAGAGIAEIDNVILGNVPALPD
ncbi:MAG: hypothetical protein JXJ17_02525 [Anaerolineae bacterium]|nr:hypothetical protein [Anaerolineae bacterium]